MKRININWEWNTIYNLCRIFGRRILCFASLRGKFASQTLHPCTALRCRVLSTKSHTKQKNTKPSAWCSFVWQGQEDSNPRPTVLEWLQKLEMPWKCSLFRMFQPIFLERPCVAVVSEIFWCFFEAMRNSRLSLLFHAWFWCSSKLKICIAVIKERWFYISKLSGLRRKS